MRLLTVPSEAAAMAGTHSPLELMFPIAPMRHFLRVLLL
jgi:hypothetical protein